MAAAWPSMSQALTRLLTRGNVHAEVSREEITALTSAGQRLGIVADDESLVVANLFQLPEIPASEVMTPRTVVEHVPADITIAELIEGRDTFPFSRLPVTGETIDDVKGFVLTRDVLLAAVRGEDDKPVSDFARTMPHVAEDTDLDSLFDMFMEQDAQIALVQDEYGGTAGVVTTEDVLETLLGTEMVDEMDEAEDLQKVARLKARRRRGDKDGQRVS